MAIRRVLLLLWLQYFATFVTSMENDFNGNDNCEGFSCIRKCCPDDKFINITTCDVPPDKSHLWTPTFYDGTVPTLMGKSPNVKYLYGVMNCEAYPIQPHINADDIFYLQTTGKLYVPLYGRYYDPDTYCIDKLYVNEDNSEEIALLCFEEESLTHAGVPCLIVKNYVYPVLLLVSWIFLFIALIVYVWIAELRTKLHGRCQISFLSSMVIGYALVLISYVALDMPAILCSFFAFLKHINLLASFFWLNVMCFDIWKSLKSMRPAAESNHKSRSRFYLYSFYAWGCPIFIGIVSEVIDNLPNTFTHLIRPGFVNEMHTCWFGSNKAMWLYFYMFVLILVICNIFFFSHVIYIIFKSENNQQLQAARSRNRDRLWLYVRIFLVMGISWITEVISFSEGSCMGWIVTDIINALQGVIIFVLFVCKKGTRSKVIKKAKMSSFATSSRRLLNYSRRSQMTSSMNVTITTQYTDASSSIDQTKSTTETSDVRQTAITNNFEMDVLKELRESTVQEYSPILNQNEDSPSVRGTPRILDREDKEILSRHELTRGKNDDPERDSIETESSESILKKDIHHKNLGGLTATEEQSASLKEETYPLMPPEFKDRK